MKKLGVLMLSLLAIPALADNNQGFYIGVGGVSIKDYQDKITDVTRIKGVEYFGGYKYNDALGVELRLGSGKSTGMASYNLPNGTDVNQRHFYDINRDIGNYRSIYYKPELVNDEAKLYGLIGYTQVATEGTELDTLSKFDGKVWNPLSKTTTNTKSTLSGFSYGVGVGFVLDEHFNINLEFRNICNEISGKPNLASVNVDYRF